MTKISIVNVVATASLNQKLDFDKVKGLKEIVYNSKKYGGRVAYFKTKNMEGRVSIFFSGKMISVGTKSGKKAFNELHNAMNFLVKIGLIKKVKLTPKIQNIVACADFEKNINIEELSITTKGIYEPEQFSALILKLSKPHTACILLFGSGKTVITGLKNEEEIEPIVQKIEEMLL